MGEVCGVSEQEIFFRETPKLKYTLGLATWVLLVGPSHIRVSGYLKRYPPENDPPTRVSQDHYVL